MSYLITAILILPGVALIGWLCHCRGQFIGYANGRRAERMIWNTGRN